MTNDHGYRTEPRWQAEHIARLTIADMLYEGATIISLGLFVATIAVWAGVITWLIR